jgi:diguanylate cyclase
MVAIAPIPANETARLDDLYSYHILGTPPEERFDMFTRVCTWIYQVPFSAINLVEADYTFFKSSVGIPNYRPARATSICAHAVAGDVDIMEIENLAEDERFRDHPMTKNGMRFYAGALLRSPEGHALGTLCIADSHPRRLSDQERAMLLELAHGVGAVMELHRSSRFLLHLASEDALTGLCNRRLFMERLRFALGKAGPGRPCTLLCLDLDGFKEVNDSYGHAAGDALLCEASRRLTSIVRTGDTVARIGGDEFAIMLGRDASIPMAERMARRILAAFAEPFGFGGVPIIIRGSIGIAAYHSGTDGEDANTLLKRGDLALYEAKRAGRGCYRLFSDVADLRSLVQA